MVTYSLASETQETVSSGPCPNGVTGNLQESCRRGWVRFGRTCSFLSSQAPSALNLHHIDFNLVDRYTYASVKVGFPCRSPEEPLGSDGRHRRGDGPDVSRPEDVENTRYGGGPEMASPDQGEKRSAWRGVGAGAILAVQLIVAVVLGFLVGRSLDHLLHTTPWLTIIGVLVGIVAGFIGIFRLSRVLLK